MNYTFFVVNISIKSQRIKWYQKKRHELKCIAKFLYLSVNFFENIYNLVIISIRKNNTHRPATVILIVNSGTA